MNVDEKAQLDSVQKDQITSWRKSEGRWWLRFWPEAISGLHMKRPPILGRAAKPETPSETNALMAMNDGRTCTLPRLELPKSIIPEISRGMLKMKTDKDDNASHSV